MDDLEVRYRKRIEEFVSGYEGSDLVNKPDEILEKSQIKPIEIAQGSYNRTSWCYEFKLLAKRNWLNQVRLPQVTGVRLMTVIILGIILALIYHPLDGTKAGVQNRSGILAMITISAGMSAIGNVGMIFPAERPVFLREVNNGMYRVSSYFWSKILSELPNSTLIPIIQGTITFWGCGMDSTIWYKYPRYMAIYWLIYNSFCGTGYILGALISNKIVITILQPVVIVPTMLFTGFFANQENIPWFLVPVQYVSIFKYGYQAMFLNEYEDLTLDCMQTTNLADTCNPVEEFNSPQGINTSMWIMLAFLFIFDTTAFLIMKSKSKQFD